MKVDHGELFEQLDPPAGGLEALRERMVEQQDSRWSLSRQIWQPAMGFAGIVLLAIWLGPMFVGNVQNENREQTTIYDSPEFDRLLGRMPHTGELKVSMNSQAVTVIELRSPDNRVRIFQLN